MATCIWRGDAPAIAQVTEWAFGGTWEATDVINVTIGGKTVAITAGSTTITTIIDTIVTTLNALSSAYYPEHSEITWSRSSSSLVGTGDTPGIPFICTISTTETGGGAADAQTIDSTTSSAGTDSTACSGPKFWSVAANWSGGAVPGNSDTVYIENSSKDICYGLAQSGVTLTALNVAKSFTGKIGLPTYNATGYYEYRATYLAISATTVSIGDGDGQGSGRIKIDTGSNAATLNITATGPQAESGVPSLLWKGAHASNAMNVYSGSIGIAALAGETATLPTLRVSYLSNLAGDANIVCGSGATLTTINKVGGLLIINSAATTITQTGGTLTIQGTGAVTTLNLRDAGQCFYNTTGTLTTLNIAGESEPVIDFSQDMRAKTVTTTNRYGLSKIRDPFKVVTFTNGIDCEQSDLRNLELGSNINAVRGSVS